MTTERGSLSVEFAILVPALVLLFSVIVGGARVWLARSTVEQTAGAAARAASLQRSSPAAQASAERVAAAQAAVSGVTCRQLSVRLHPGALARPAGHGGEVVAEVTCDAPLSDILVPGWPGTVRLTASSSSAVDSYRERK